MIIYAIYYILTAKNLILKAFFSLVSILSLITLFITSLGKLIWEQLFSVIDSILSGAIFSDIRVEIIIKGIRSLEQSFWFGHGAGTSEYVIEKSSTKYVTTSAPHNLLLELGVEYGLVGAILLIFFFLFYLINFTTIENYVVLIEMHYLTTLLQCWGLWYFR